MPTIPKTIRIEPAFDDPEFVREMFERNAPYRTMAGSLPIKAQDSFLPWFRGNWATNGEPLVAGAQKILHNRRFIDAASRFFGGSTVRPTFVVVNVSAPMPAGLIHVDVPTFRGATRDRNSLAFLVCMGQFALFESWRVIQAGAVAWFYDGPGGNFEYWPEGLQRPMRTECPPFRNVALMSDNDQIHHRIGHAGDPEAPPPRMTSAAEIRCVGGAWEIVEHGETRATYPPNAARLSLVWKAVREPEPQPELLNLDRIMTIFISHLRRRRIDFKVPAEPLLDTEWLALWDRVYYVRTDSENPEE